MTDNPTRQRAVPSVSVTYARNGASTKANALGMRPMQERAFEKRGEQYLLIKSPPASGKSRALMFVALDKRNRSRAQVHLTLSVLDSEARFVYRGDHASDHGHDSRPTLFARCRFDPTAAVGAPRLGT
jgi:hypothetical protein